MLSTSAFSIVAVTVTNSGTGGYRLNGATDAGTTAASAFTQPISAIGARASGTGQENFNGAICEIDIYDHVLSAAEISAVELAMTNSYITSTLGAPTVLVQPFASPSMAMAGGNDTLTAYFYGTLPISYQWQKSATADFSSSTPILGATNNTLTLTNLQLTDSGTYYRVVATNLYSPYSVTSAPVQLSVVPLTPLVQLIATNYDGSSVWTDSSGNGNSATYTGSPAPTLASFVTPNGGSAVNITSTSGYFTLASSLAASSGYTVFAYFQPTATNGTGRFALVGGTTGSLEYNYYQGHQNYLVEYTGGGGAGTGNIPTNSFSLVNLTVNAAAGSFRLNGAPDGSVAGATFSQPLSLIGNNHGHGDAMIGNIAELDIYSGVLTFAQITNLEAQLTAKYVTAETIVIGAATVSPTNNTYAGNPITLNAPVIGGTGTTTYQWQTDNGSGGASFADIGGAIATNYLLSTTGLLGTYQYRLVGTPFGGSSVTGAPVSLTVNAASAPLVSSDTSANPNPASVGGNSTFSAAFAGNLPISYQWQVSPNADGSGASNVAGATNTTLTLSNLQLTNSGYYYSLRASNSVAPDVANSSWLQLNVVPLTPVLQLLATNYVGAGEWDDSSGNYNNAYYAGTTVPTLVPFLTPNGSPAVNISAGGGSFLLTTPLSQSGGYTVVAYASPTVVSNGSARFALTGGSSAGALEYNFYQGHQNYLVEYTGGGGAGATNIPASSFSLVDLAVNASGGAFRYNGVADGATVPGATFTQPITRIGNNEGSGDSFVGQIAEIDVYSGVLTYLQITNLEAQLTARYVTTSTIVIGTATVSPTNNVYAGTSVTLSAPVLGGTETTTYQWQTDNGTSGSAFSNIGGANSTNYVLNTTSLNGTYEYQLIGTPFGGNSVTSAPVTLTVQPALAPLLVSDTSANPNPATLYGSSTLSASFTGTEPIGYQWQRSPNSDGTGASNIAGATNASLMLGNLQPTDFGKYYSLQASNSVAPHVATSSWLQLTQTPLAALIQLVATNYDPVSGIWTNVGGINNATYAGTQLPTLLSGVTPDGASVVNIIGNDGSFVFDSPLDQSEGYTVFAYIMPAVVSNGGARYALTGGSSSGALEYNFYQGHQNYLIEYTGGGGAGTATIPTSSFSLIDVAVNSAGAAFRLNGVADGSVPGATFTQPITRIGNNHGFGDGLTGKVAELDIYSGALSYAQITNLEAQLTARFGAIVTVATNPTNLTAKLIAPNTLQLSWPPDHTGWRLLMQTNNLNRGVSDNLNDWAAVPGSQSINSTNITIVNTNLNEYYRLVYP